MTTTHPMPGLPVRGSKSGKPIMALFDLLGRSWSLGIIWQLSDGTPATFRQLQDRCETVSPTVLNKRLKELRACALVDHDGSGYHLTPLGLELFEMLHPFGAWSTTWSEALQEQQDS